MATAAEAALLSLWMRLALECASFDVVRAFLQGRAGTYIVREDAFC